MLHVAEHVESEKGMYYCTTSIIGEGKVSVI